MTAEDKKRLLDKLTETHVATRALLEGIDLGLSIYADWQVRDIIGHMAVWNRHVAEALDAFRVGTEYLIPGWIENEDRYNQQLVLVQRELSSQQVVEEWKQAYEELKKAIQEIPLDKFPGDLVYPWGDERGSIAQLVEYFIDHDVEHHDEIAKAVQASSE